MRCGMDTVLHKLLGPHAPCIKRRRPQGEGALEGTLALLLPALIRPCDRHALAAASAPAIQSRLYTLTLQACLLCHVGGPGCQDRAAWQPVGGILRRIRPAAPENRAAGGGATWPCRATGAPANPPGRAAGAGGSYMQHRTPPERHKAGLRDPLACAARPGHGGGGGGMRRARARPHGRPRSGGRRS